jgi:hypothetical protein
MNSLTKYLKSIFVSLRQSVIDQMQCNSNSNVVNTNRQLIEPNTLQTISNGSSDITDQSRLRLHKPVQVIQVPDTHSTQKNIGRIVISGRMADVCAELDRLVALEMA